jgi:hypothetical protein
MLKMLFTMVMAGAIWLFVLLPEVNAFDREDLLSLPIRATVIKGESIDQVLDLLAVEYGIPVGIELGDSKLKRQEIDWTVPETNVKAFLDSLITKDSRYTWKLEGDIIHVWPVTERDPFVTTLLNTKISHFSFTEGTTRSTIFNNIVKLPEIQTQLSVAEVAPLIFLNFGSMHRVGKGISFYESNLTLRELLDRIVLKTDIKRWVIIRWGDRGEYITLRS